MINDFACFYEFSDQANTRIKHVFEIYKIKAESEETRKRQQKDAEDLQQKMKEERHAQIQTEKEIRIASEKIEKLDQEMKEEFQKRRKTIKEKIHEAKKLHNINENENNCYNFAFAGHTKTGKSSLINAIRGIADKEAIAAKVGITETTQIVQKYPYHDNNHKNVAINFYDIPGSGTLSHDASQYYHEKGLCAFDCLFILVQETFCEEEIKFAIAALKNNQKVAFIQSKCDILLTNKKKQKLIKEISQKAVNDCLIECNVKENHRREIAKTDISQLRKIPCFYVSSINLFNLKKGFEADLEVNYNEKELLEFMMAEVKYSRNFIGQ
uniref:IRG-type G domain-containing protein n=1 Tax=Panagrolaimus superbus TaxID=310955 RepID=A0A914Z4S4_9BILA